MTFWMVVLAVLVGIEISVILNVITRLVITKVRWWLLLLPLILVACTHGSVPPEPRVGDANAKITVASAMIIDRARWQQSGYSRDSEDAAMTFPVFVVLAGDGTACIVDGMTWGSWIRYDVVKCPGKWRMKRP